MNKEITVYIYERNIQFFEKKKKFVICGSVDKLVGHYAKWSKPNTKRQVLHDTTYM